MAAVFEQCPADSVTNRTRGAGDDGDAPGQPRVLGGGGRGINDLEGGHVAQRDNLGVGTVLCLVALERCGEPGS